jgi:hypothetical protein
MQAWHDGLLKIKTASVCSAVVHRFANAKDVMRKL